MFAIDLRTLSAFRIALGLMLLIDLATRLQDLRAMYTDQGMFSRMEICRRFSTVWNWSFHFASGSLEFQSVLFGVAAVLAFCLIVGLQTRFATLGSWLMLLSLQHRVPPILNGADTLLRMLLFWAIFLPTGLYWSLDGRRARNCNPSMDPAPPEGVFLSIGSAAILLQMAMMYLFSAVYKSNIEWFRGNVIAAALSHDMYAKPLAKFLLDYPISLTVLTWGILALEWFGPILLFIPRFSPRVRLSVVCMLALMHLCVEALLEVGMFSLVSLAGLLLFLPGEIWRGGWGRLTSQRHSEAHARYWRESRWFARWSQLACSVCLVYVIWINTAGLPLGLTPRHSSGGSSALWTGLGFGQKWNMFDEAPSKSGWYVARATLSDGSEVDLLQQGNLVNWRKPLAPAQMYSNHRWRKVFREISYDDALGYQVFREPVSEFLCRDWDSHHIPSKHVARFDLFFCSERAVRSPGAAPKRSSSRERLLRLDYSGS